MYGSSAYATYWLSIRFFMLVILMSVILIFIVVLIASLMANDGKYFFMGLLTMLFYFWGLYSVFATYKVVVLLIWIFLYKFLYLCNM